MNEAEFKRWEHTQLQGNARDHYRRQIAYAYELAELDRKIAHRQFFRDKVQRYKEWAQREQAGARQVYIGGGEWADIPTQEYNSAVRSMHFWLQRLRENEALDYRRTVVRDNLLQCQWWGRQCSTYMQEYLQ